MGRAVQPGSLENLVGLVIEHGPRGLSEMAASLKTPEETVRHRLKKQLLERGITVHAAVDMRKLGMTWLWGIVKLNPMLLGHEQLVGRLLAEVSYLRLYAKMLASRLFLVVFSIPEIHKEALFDLCSRLAEEQLWQTISLHAISHFHYVPMRTELYRFEERIWDIDWAKLKAETPRLPSLPPSPPERFDSIDLATLVQLQTNADQNLTTIARKVNVNRQKLKYHYSEHIRRRGFIERYLVRWTGPPKQPLRHAILSVKFWIEGFKDSERAMILSTFYKLPFTWSISISDETNFLLADCLIPTPQYPDTLQYLDESLAGNSTDLKQGIVDPSCTSAYAIPHFMYDEKQGWLFDPRAVTAGIKQLALTISEK